MGANTPAAFGFSNDVKHFEAVCEYRDAALADGWEIRPTYKTEPVERASHLERDGFVLSVISRDNREWPLRPWESTPRRWKFEAKLAMWGPDGMAIVVPPAYDFAAMKAGLRHCEYCGADDVDTHRVSFAGRCCAVCLPAMRAKLEQPGWCD